MRFMRTAQNTEPVASTQTRIDAPEGAYLLLATLREDKKGAAASDYGQDLQKGAICPGCSDYTSFGLATMMPAFVR